jgi:thioredoxin 1
MSNKKKVKFKDLIGSSQPVLVDFYATWCGPCKALSPVIKEVKAELGDSMKVLKVDIDKNKSVAHKYKIQSVPTLAIFQRGKMIWRESGMKTKSQLVKIARQHLEN